MPQQKEKKLAGGGRKNPWRERRGPARVGLGSARRALQALSWPHVCPGPSSLVLSSVVTSPGASAPCCVGVKGSSGNCWHPRLTLPPKNRVITNGMITLSRTFPPRVRKETRPRCAPSGGGQSQPGGRDFRAPISAAPRTPPICPPPASFTLSSMTRVAEPPTAHYLHANQAPGTLICPLQGKEVGVASRQLCMLLTGWPFPPQGSHGCPSCKRPGHWSSLCRRSS